MKNVTVIAALLLALAHSALAQEVSTVSFADRPIATYPRTMEGKETLTVDLSAIPAGTAVHRAVLRPGREEGEAFAQRDVAVRVVDGKTGKPLELLPPRFASFDATAAVRAAVGGKAVFRFDTFPGYQPVYTRLDVTCGARAPNAIPRVNGLSVRHHAGQTILTWAEVKPTLLEDAVTFRQWRAWRDAPDPAWKKIRYRIYRSAEPFTAATVARAELVDEVGPLTGWNPDFYGISPRDDARVPRFVVDAGRPAVAPGTGLYFHNPGQAGKAYYAVSASVQGEEDLSTFDEGNATAAAVEESVGQGLPVLQRVEKPKSFSYVDAPALHYYVRWEAPPNVNLPSRPYDYLVAVPAKPVEPAPVGLHLHCWGGSLEGGYGWWYNAAQGAVLIATNQIPYDWWTGYHEHSGTWKSWKEGVIRDYTQTRVMSFYDWAATQWKLDASRVFTAGTSMGGSGSPNLALRRADRVAWVVSWVGVHTPADTPQFRGSYERVYGLVPWKLPAQDGKTAAFDWFDDAWYVRQDVARETPLIAFSNGKNDGGIGWSQARRFWKALQETRRPHVFVWGQGGHGQRALLPGPNPGERELGVDLRLDRTLPAFTNCSLDENPGNGDPKDGAAEGQSNLHLYWETGDDAVIDEPGRWGMTLKLNRRAPQGECTVDVTPRRCRQFKTGPGAKVKWRNVGADSKEVQAGEAAADSWGLVTVPRVQVTRGGNRLMLEVMR